MSGIAPYDIFVILLLVLLTLWGGFRGMFSQITSIISLVASWFISSRCYSLVSPMVPLGEPWKDSISVLILFFIVMFACRLLGKMLGGAVKQTKLKEFDRQMGALCGLIKGCVICLLITFFAVISAEQSRSLVVSSRSGQFMVRVISSIEKYVPENSNHAKIREALEQFADSASKEGASVEPVSLAEEVDQVKAKLGDMVKREAGEAAADAFGLDANTVSNPSEKPSNNTADQNGESTTNDFFSSLKSEFGSIWGKSNAVTVSSSAEAPPASDEMRQTSLLTDFSGNGVGVSITVGTAQHDSGGSILDRRTFTAASTAPPF